MMVHILSQWGSLMCEQDSGRAVNRPLYEAVRGELGRQWRGLSHICPCVHIWAWPVCFDGSRRLAWLLALFTLAGEFPLNEKLTSQVASEPQVQFVSSQGFCRVTFDLLYWNDKSWWFKNMSYEFSSQKGVWLRWLRKAGIIVKSLSWLIHD